MELRYTDRKLLAHEFYGGFGAGNGADLGNDPNAAILLPVIEFLTNDAWPLVRAMANGGACPLLIMDRYSKGVLYVLTIPDNFADLYRLPPAVTSCAQGLFDAWVSRFAWTAPARWRCSPMTITRSSWNPTYPRKPT